MEKKHNSRKEVYAKPEVFTHEPLRNITAEGPGGATVAPSMGHTYPG